jgi:hypothetical protein
MVDGTERMQMAQRIVGRPYLVFAALSGVLGVMLCIRWASVGAVGFGCIIGFLPAIAFLIAHNLSRKWRSWGFHAVAIPLCAVGIGFWGLSVAGMDLVIYRMAEVTNVRKYEEILDTRWDSRSELVNHFPRPIPADAKTVRFSFRPGFMQRGTYIQLRCSLPPEQIEERYAYFARKRTRSFFGGDMRDHINMKDGMPTTFFYTGEGKDRRFPTDYEIMVLDEVPKEEDHPGGISWRHARCHGVAISRERHEIVYWAEAW